MQIKWTDKEKEYLLESLFKAYFDARKNKRKTINALHFELDYERNLFQLYREICQGTYKIGPGICFINYEPVQREVFAASFRDRVVHHLLFSILNPLVEPRLIHDSYSCRKGKGVHYGIQRVERFLQSCTENYTKEAYILKLDIKGYFMSMDRELLYQKVKAIVNKQEVYSIPKEAILHLLHLVIFNDCVGNCIIKGKKSDWDGLPASKSLFTAKKGKGFPIGNLTSQLFGNIYLNSFDHYVKGQLGIRYYGRYVDDFVLVHSDKEHLLRCIEEIRRYLLESLGLVLHPDKVYLQRARRGLQFLGTRIRPYRKYVGSRSKHNFYKALKEQNALPQALLSQRESQAYFIACMNSYLGLFQHSNSYKLCKYRITKDLSAGWKTYVYPTKSYNKFVLKTKAKPTNITV